MRPPSSPRSSRKQQRVWHLSTMKTCEEANPQGGSGQQHHSFDSDENVANIHATPPSKKDGSSGGSGSTNPNQGSSSSLEHEQPQRQEDLSQLEKIWSQAGRFFTPNKQVIQRNVDLLTELVGEACSSNPCHTAARNYASVDSDVVVVEDGGISDQSPVPVISKLIEPTGSPNRAENRSSGALAQAKRQAVAPAPAPKRQPQPAAPSPMRSDTAVERRRRQQQRQPKLPRSPIRRQHEDIEVLPNHKVQVRLPPTTSKQQLLLQKHAPLETLEVKTDAEAAAELERSISELTMRSAYVNGAESSLNKIPDNRRMAYYAVGKHHRQSGRGGNRRCYFTGKLILGGAPFYAGSVQQGLRTLVVFCLPSALGLPTQSQRAAAAAATAQRQNSGGSRHSRNGGGGGTISSSSLLLEQRLSRSKRQFSVGEYSVASKSMSRLSTLGSLDDLSLSIEGDLDPNWGLDRDYLLSVLPPACASLMKQMADLYPEQFETLPVQVRDPSQWKLYIKFCFFSGLPIAEGEMHYKVRDDIADQVYGEEIVLSHDVMEAVNGESAEILMLPNQKAFRYLRKHYAQQCSKLDDRVFQRSTWERVAPEV